MASTPTTPSIKGTHVLDTVRALRNRREEALEVLPGHLVKYLDNRILISSWYPEADMVELRKALAKLVRNVPDVWTFFGANAARAQAEKIYRGMVARGDVAQTLRNMPKYWTLYHNTGRLGTTVLGPTEARFEIFDY